MNDVVIIYRASKAGTSPYHAGGLAANALQTVNVLRSMGVYADLYAVRTVGDIVNYIEERAWPPGSFPKFVVVEAIWLTTNELDALADRYPRTRFVVRAHSKTGFLQVEPEAIPKIRDVIAMSARRPNVSFSSNNEEFCRALREVYGECVYLPNLYDIDGAPHAENSDDVLRIASFGATRLLKLHPNAALAALQIAKRMDRPLKFYVNSDSTPGAESVQNTIRNLFVGVPDARLIEIPWQDPETFRQTIAGMDLVLQLSCTETFCLVAADAVASGVPVVVGPAIAWVPGKYQANIDDTSEVATTGVRAIEKRVAPRQLKALEDFVCRSKDEWSRFLGVTKKKGSWSLF